MGGSRAGRSGPGRRSLRVERVLRAAARVATSVRLSRVQLLEDVAEVVLRRVLADPELGRDLLVAPSGRDQAEDVELARRQPVRAPAPRPARPRLDRCRMIRAAVAGVIAASPRATVSIIDRSWAASRFFRR